MALLKRAFGAVQHLVHSRKVLSGHDISDGGIVVALMEMTFSSPYGIDCSGLSSRTSTYVPPHELLFAEEPGLLLEVDSLHLDDVLAHFKIAQVPCTHVGTTTKDQQCKISVNGESCIDASSAGLRNLWESTSFDLEQLQAAPACVDAEVAYVSQLSAAPSWAVPFDAAWTPAERLQRLSGKARVAIIREEGSNGDREMAAAVYAGGVSALNFIPPLPSLSFVLCLFCLSLDLHLALLAIQLCTLVWQCRAAWQIAGPCCSSLPCCMFWALPAMFRTCCALHSCPRGDS